MRTDIEGKFTNPKLDKQGMLAESKVGIDRIVEALQCNMWSNMVQKPMGDLRGKMMGKMEYEIQKEEGEYRS